MKRNKDPTKKETQSPESAAPQILREIGCTTQELRIIETMDPKRFHLEFDKKTKQVGKMDEYNRNLWFAEIPEDKKKLLKEISRNYHELTKVTFLDSGYVHRIPQIALDQVQTLVKTYSKIRNRSKNTRQVPIEEEEEEEEEETLECLYDLEQKKHDKRVKSFGSERNLILLDLVALESNSTQIPISLHPELKQILFADNDETKKLKPKHLRSRDDYIVLLDLLLLYKVNRLIEKKQLVSRTTQTSALEIDENKTADRELFAPRYCDLPFLSSITTSTICDRNDNVSIRDVKNSKDSLLIYLYSSRVVIRILELSLELKDSDESIDSFKSMDSDSFESMLIRRILLDPRLRFDSIASKWVCYHFFLFYRHILGISTPQNLEKKTDDGFSKDISIVIEILNLLCDLAWLIGSFRPEPSRHNHHSNVQTKDEKKNDFSNEDSDNDEDRTEPRLNGFELFRGVLPTCLSEVFEKKDGSETTYDRLNDLYSSVLHALKRLCSNKRQRILENV